MKNKLLGLILLTIISIMMFYSCEHQPVKLKGESKIDSTSSQNNDCNPDSVYFENSVLPIIISNCNGTGCHNANDHADGVNLSSYANIINYINPGNATNSKMYKNMTTSSKIMPPSGKLPQATLDLIKKWINQGAKNNKCNNGCDTTKFTYSADISKIIETNCLGCHSNGTTKIGTYNELITQVNNGKLIGTITHSSGFLPMPSSSFKLKNCEILKIQKWISNGAPNN